MAYLCNHGNAFGTYEKNQDPCNHYMDDPCKNLGTCPSNSLFEKDTIYIHIYVYQCLNEVSTSSRFF